VRLSGADHEIVRLRLLQHQPHGRDIFAGVPPVAFGFEIAQTQLLLLARQNPGDAGGDFPRDELEAAPRRFVVEQNPVGGEGAIRLTIVAGQVESAHLADAVAGTRMERSRLRLRHLMRLPEHFARTGKIKPAAWSNFAQRREQKVGAVDVRVECRELVVERVTDETLGGQMIALIRRAFRHHLEDAGKTLNRTGMKV
jgi:hypothetical protein